MSFLPASEYLALPRNPHSWVVEDILPTGGLLNIYGKPKTHKSFLALQIAEAIANPEIMEVVGFPLHQHGKVAYLQVDTPRGLWSDRLMQCFSPLSDNIAFADADLPDLPYPLDIMTEGFQWLKEGIAALQPLVVIIDTLREVHSGDENDSTHMRNMINTLAKACKPSACIVVSHARKNQAEGGFSVMDENRGSGYVAGRMDAVLALSRESMTYQSRTAGLEIFPILRTPRICLKDPIEAMVARLARNSSLRETEKVDKLRARYPAVSPDSARGKIRRRESAMHG